MSVDETLKNPKAVALLIDHTVLKPDASQEDIARACAEAHHYGFASVCINPYWVRFAAAALEGSSVRVCTTVGFPLGASESATKLAEAELALQQGATELDMVQNIGALRSSHFEAVESEARQLAQLSHSRGAILKIILETCLLSEEEKATSCRLAVKAGADFVKTSTGFATAGATIEDVRLMRRVVGRSAGVKAAGGIRTLETLRAMVKAGANRIGTSSGVQILRELEGGEGADEPKPLPAAKVPGGHLDTY
ncbi:MAG TPA: deoxyribose-phosphate aldolase [Bryobacteraceae bacterium]|jgi:deoxyribose-phosphate aldolase